MSSDDSMIEHDRILREVMEQVSPGKYESIKRQKRETKRPIGMVILGAVNGLIGVYLLYFGLFDPIMVSLRSIIGPSPVYIGLGIAFIVVAYSLIQLKPWGGILAIGIYAMTIYYLFDMTRILWSFQSYGIPGFEDFIVAYTIQTVIIILALALMAGYVIWRRDRFMKIDFDVGEYLNRRR
ncbi:MAG: hypothetical protein ACFFD4_05995 [Candidatus Odinarchaeota archaeon]